MRRSRIPWLVLALLLLLPSVAQADRGIRGHYNCTSYTSPEAGLSYCFDATANTLKKWNGSAWIVIWNLVAAVDGGTGINTSASTGVPTIAAGTWSVAAQLSATRGGTGLDTSAATGTARADAGTWSVGRLRHDTGTTLPATCTVGDAFFKTDASAGQNVYGCTTTNTWTLEGDGTGAAPSGDITSVGNCATGDCFQAAAANTVLASPDGAAGQATMRALVTADIPASMSAKTFTGASVWTGNVVGAQYGGTGQNTSASTGVPSISAGTWSIGTRLGAALGGTNIDTSASTGVPTISSGTWSTAAQLAAARGGTALDTSGSTGVPSIAAGTWSVPAQVAAGKGGTGLDTSASTGTPRVDAGTWSVGTPIANSSTIAGLPAAAVAGRVYRLSDGGSAGALVIDDGTTIRCAEQKSQQVIIITCPPYNAKGDYLSSLDGAMASGSTTLTTTTAIFTSADVGKAVAVQGAGTGGATIDDAELVWTSDDGANVTVTLETTIKKEGTNSAKIAIGASFTTGTAAHFVRGSSVSANTSWVMFWIRSTTTTAAGDLSLVLKDSSSVATQTVSVPALTADTWKQVFARRTTTLADTKEIALVVNVDGGAQTVYLDLIRGGQPLTTTVSGFTSTTQVTLAASASVEVAGAEVQVGTDDTAAVIAAEAACPAGGCEIVIPYGPAGRYLISDDITYRSHQRWRFLGGAGFVLKSQSVANLAALHVAIISPAVAGSTVDVRFVRPFIDGNREFNPTTNRGDCLALTGVTTATVTDVVIDRCPRNAVFIGSAATPAVDIHVKGARITNTGLYGINGSNGIAIVAAAAFSIEDFYIDGVQAGGGAFGTGVDLEPNSGDPKRTVVGGVVRDGYIKNAGGPGFSIYNATSTLMVDDILVENTLSESNQIGFRLNGPATGPQPFSWRVIGNTAYRNLQEGFFTSNADALTFVGNTAAENGQQTANTYSGFRVHRGNNTFTNNRAWDDQGTKTQKYGFEEVTGASTNKYIGNMVASHATGKYLILSNASLLLNNGGDEYVLGNTQLALGNLADPEVLLHLRSSSSDDSLTPRVYLERYDTASGAGGGVFQLQFRRSKGTLAAPAAVADGDSLGIITAFGANNTTPSYTQAATVEFLADGTPGAGSRTSGKVCAKTTATSGSSSPQDALCVRADGNVRVSRASQSSAPLLATAGGIDSDSLRTREAAASTAASGTGITIAYDGEVTRGVYKITVVRSAWIAAALTQDLTIFTAGARQKIASVYADVTLAFAGLAGTIQLSLGKTAGGIEYLTAFDCKTAVITRGLVDGDLGTSINRANAVQGGDMPSWTTTTAITARLTSGTGNIGTGSATNLTAGTSTVVFYVGVESLP